MSGVDNRVVKMTFDNASFQRNVEGTMSSLDKLKASLNFSKGTDGMKQLSAAASNVNLGPIATSIESVSSKFLALSTVAITVLSGITAKAASAGAQFVKSMAIDPILAGYKEYETNIGSIQTILANTQSKGTNLEQVNAALDELNTYSDKTIYNFSQMAKNVGTFTAAGLDLDTSVTAIKGIANLAALSGSTSEQASSAMYQLSQAMASGTVKAQDWISVVNSNMGGEVFQKSLFESGKALGTLKDVPLSQTFDEWKASGNTFRGSLEDGWITADVLSTTLGGLSGDLDGAALSAKGFSDEQIVAIQATAATATAAAVDVKTASQLFSTIGETIGSGWSASFRAIFGNFTEAKALFTGLNNYIGGFIAKSSDARNQLLEGWKAFGGRDLLVGSLMNAFAALKGVLGPIKDAFREVFPPQTAAGLISLTQKLNDFTKSLIPTENTMQIIKSVFAGFFSVIKIGVEIVKGVFSVFTNLASTIFSIVSPLGNAGAGVGNFVTKLQQMLVEGGGIKKFFDFINDGVSKMGEFIIAARDKIAELFSGGIPGGDKASGVLDSIKEKFSGLSTVGEKAQSAFERVKETFSNAFNGVKGVLEKAWTAISGFFSGLGSRLKDVFTADAFEPILQTFGVGFLGGITVLLAKFFKNGLKLDFGQSGLLESLTGTFDQLTSTIKTFQTSIRADNLLKIASAMAILAVSIIALSLVDSAKIATSLGALAIGMGQLVAALALLTKIEANPVKLAGLAVAMGLLGIAALGLSISVKILSTLSWEELATGLAGIAGAIGVMALATAAMGKNNASFIRAGVSLAVLSVSLWLFSKVIQSYGSMDWDTLKQGLAGVAISLGLFVAAVNLIPNQGMFKLGLSFIAFAFGLSKIRAVVEDFAQMTWEDMIKGFLGLAVGLGIIVGAVALLQKFDFAEISAGMLIFSAALYVMAKSVETLGTLSLGDLVKGLVGIAAVMAILVVATNAFQGSLAGAGAMVVVAGAMFVLGRVLESFSDLSWGDLLKGLVGIAAVLAVLGLAAFLMQPLLPALLGLGIALGVVGIAFALFGVGAYLTAKALVELGNAGKSSIKALVEILDTIIKAIPGFVQAFAEGIISLVHTLIDAAPDMIDAFGDILIQMIDKVIEITPKIGEAFSEILGTAIEVMRERGPDLITVGFELLTAFLQGLSDNIEEITVVAIEILTKFATALGENIQILVDAVVNLIVVFSSTVAARIGDVIAAGASVMVAFLQGVTNSLGSVITAVTQVIVTFIGQVGAMAGEIAAAGFRALVAFIFGIASGIGDLITAIFNIITTIITEIGNGAGRVATAGKDTTIKFLDGLVDNTIDFANKVGAMLVKLLEGLTKAVEKYAPQIREASKDLGFAVIDGMSGGMLSKAGDAIAKAKDIAGSVIGTVKGVFDSNSPSKVFHAIGQDVVTGLANGLTDNTRSTRAAKNMAKDSVAAFTDILNGVAYGLEGLEEFNPKITPVLDLTKVKQDANSMSALMGGTQLQASVSYGNAQQIAHTTEVARQQQQIEATSSGPTEVSFEQNIYSPTALSANDIYRNTRSQIVLAKEELSIP